MQSWLIVQCRIFLFNIAILTESARTETYKHMYALHTHTHTHTVDHSTHTLTNSLTIGPLTDPICKKNLRFCERRARVARFFRKYLQGKLCKSLTQMQWSIYFRAKIHPLLCCVLWDFPDYGSMDYPTSKASGAKEDEIFRQPSNNSNARKIYDPPPQNVTFSSCPSNLIIWRAASMQQL